MKFLLAQPNWRFEGSTYFGCPETHLPLELLYSRQVLEAAGHEALILDGQLEGLDAAEAAERARRYAPDFLVMTTAPTYLFWRCPQPELRLPATWLAEMRRACPRAVMVAIGPHGSATPAAVLRKLQCDVVVMGEAEPALPRLAGESWERVGGLAWRTEEGLRQTGGLNQQDMQALGPLHYSGYPLERRRHRHHVFHGQGRGAEVEASRGCPWSCTFCNKTLFRNRHRARKVEAVADEVERLAAAGFDYVYFIDEIFGCGRETLALLEALAGLPVSFGVQTRIDLWNEETLELLGRAGCISLECGIESISEEGRERFRKGCRLSLDRMQTLLRTARRHIGWVQANLIADEVDAADDLAAIERWRQDLVADGVWVSQPVPVFAYPGTPLYRELFGEPDDAAWERAHRHYLEVNTTRGYLSDVQDQTPRPLAELEDFARRER